MIVLNELGITNLNNICMFVAPNDVNNFSLFLSTFRNPLYIVIILTIKLINKAMMITLFILAPAIIIIRGPKATFGNEFIIVKKGSIILAKVGNSYNIIAINKPKVVPNIKEINTSLSMVNIWLNKL